MDSLGTYLLLSLILAAGSPFAHGATRPADVTSGTPASAAPPRLASPGQDCAAIDNAGVAALFDKWNVALASLDPDTVVQRYWDDAVLLPAISNTPRTSPAMVRDYFVHFLGKHPRGRIENRIVRLGCNLAVDMGTYTLSTMDADGAPGEVSERYTYVYAWRSGEWKILHHHSSAMPELPAAPSASAPAYPGAVQGRAPTAAARPPDPVAQPGRQPDGDIPTVDSTRMFLNADASPPVMEFYPPEARSRRETGHVAMRVCADPEGRLVGEPKVLRSSGHERLDAAARRWARAAKWVPATSNRRSVEGCTEVTAQFRP